MTEFVKSTQELIDNIDEKWKSLKKDPDRERTRSYHTQKMLRDWFMRNGNLPV